MSSLSFNAVVRRLNSTPSIIAVVGRHRLSKSFILFIHHHCFLPSLVTLFVVVAHCSLRCSSPFIAFTPRHHLLSSFMVMIFCCHLSHRFSHLSSSSHIDCYIVCSISFVDVAHCSSCVSSPSPLVIICYHHSPSSFNAVVCLIVRCIVRHRHTSFLIIQSHPRCGGF